MSKPQIVTIARQFGSLGRAIAMKAAELMEINFYDRDIVEAAAQKMGLPVSTISEQEEAAKSSFYQMKFPLGIGTSNMQDSIFYEQKKIIMDITDRESCIIVGRCADYILQDRENVIKIYIYASYEERLKNCLETLGMSKENAKKMIRDVDRARASYHKHYAGYLPGDYNQMDFMLNSGSLGVDGTAELIRDIVCRKTASR